MVTTSASVREERAVAEIRRISHAGLTGTELMRRAARALHRAVPFEIYAAATIDPASNLITHAFAEAMDREGQVRPASPAWFEHFYFQEGFDQTVDMLRRGQWATTIEEETNGHPDWSLCYRDSMRPAGIEHKLHAIFVDRNLWGDIELYRPNGCPPFSARELELVRRIAPDVGVGLRVAALNARAEKGGQPAETTPGVVVIDASGQITATPAAERLLTELGPLDPRWRGERELPVPVQVVLGALERTLAPRAAADRQVMPRLQARAQSGRWLTLHAARSEDAFGRPSEQTVVIAPAHPEEVAWLGVAAYDLSPREEEVVKLVVGGHSTKQIADRLFIAEHTVQRHLSNIFEKVGVRSRRALVKQLFFEQVLPGASAV